MKTIFSHAISAMACIAPAYAQRVDPTALFDRANANQDSAISREEFLAARAALFPALDRNGDGALSAQEYLNGAPAGAAGMMVSSMFSRLDTNGDKALSAEEYNTAPTPGFDRVDSNGDGVLGDGEIAAARRTAS